MVRERDKSGQYVETVGLDDVLGVFDRVRGPVITSSDVAEVLDCTTEAARQKLKQLHERGEVDRRKTGRTVVWWRTGGRESAHASRDDAGVAPGPSPSVDGARSEGASTDESGGATDEGAHPALDVPPVDDETRELVASTLADHDFPGRAAKYDGRIDATARLYATLQAHAGEWLEKHALLSVVDDDGEHGYDDAASFWSNFVVKDARHPNALTILPGVESSGKPYRYTEPADADV
jgi:hypothetical protein